MDISGFTDWMMSSICSPELWPNPTWLICFVVFIAMVRFLKLFSFPEKPQVTYLRKPAHAVKPSVADVLSRCPILEEIYVPPLIWGRNGHIQTATYGLLGHVSLKRTYNKRHIVTLSDGSSVIFDVFEPVASHLSGRDYTLVLCPGIANSSESNYIRTCVHNAQEKGYRCAVLNHLGALPNVQLTSTRIFSYGGTEELEAMMTNLCEIYPETRFISIGFSMGANITTRYLAKLPAASALHCKIIFGLSVAQGYCATTSASLYHDWENGRRAYNYIITENMKRLLRKNYDMAVAPHVKSGLVDEQRLWSATSLIALDEHYNRRVLGYPSVSDFYASCSSISLLSQLTIPMVFLNAQDDPIMPPQLWIPVRDMAAVSEQFGFILTKHGGHLGFLEGCSFAPNPVTWIDRFIVELASAAVVVYDGY